MTSLLKCLCCFFDAIRIPFSQQFIRIWTFRGKGCPIDISIYIFYRTHTAHVCSCSLLLNYTDTCYAFTLMCQIHLIFFIHKFHQWWLRVHHRTHDTIHLDLHWQRQMRTFYHVHWWYCLPFATNSVSFFRWYQQNFSFALEINKSNIFSKHMSSVWWWKDARNGSINSIHYLFVEDFYCKSKWSEHCKVQLLT